MGTTKTCSPLKILFAVAESTYSDAEEKLVAGIPWPAGTTTRVLAVVSGGLPFVGLRPDGNGVAQETLAAICMQEWAAAEALVGRVADRLRASDLSTEALVCDGRSSEAILKYAEAVSADLIAIGARGLSAPGQFRLGATARRLAYCADRSVLVGRRWRGVIR